MDLNETLSINQAMARVGVSRRTIYNWIYKNKLSYVRTAGGAIRIHADSLWRQGKTPAQKDAA
jgi:excisionase family DNA binding protein